MDAFLRRVLERRELEQEAELLRLPGIATATCALCGQGVGETSLHCVKCVRPRARVAAAFESLPLRAVPDVPNPLESELRPREP